MPPGAERRCFLDERRLPLADSRQLTVGRFTALGERRPDADPSRALDFSSEGARLTKVGRERRLLRGFLMVTEHCAGHSAFGVAGRSPAAVAK